MRTGGFSTGLGTRGDRGREVWRDNQKEEEALAYGGGLAGAAGVVPAAALLASLTAIAAATPAATPAPTISGAPAKPMPAPPMLVPIIGSVIASTGAVVIAI